ncbi:MAG: 2-oxoglutarate dehydrogenase E1 component, partial [Saprospiraceae bacterium]|nr:2-oxoglutarate dehydrogenase E1 component [Saprospiraceae bacterium]
MKTDFSFISNSHPAYIESLYRQYQNDPSSVDDSWRQFFKGFEFASEQGASYGEQGASLDNIVKEFSVLSLIHGYRQRGHLLSTTNPIKQRRDRKPHLSLNDYGLNESDLNTVFYAGTELGLKNATLKEIVTTLENIY